MAVVAAAGPGYNGSVKNTTVNGGYDHETEKAPCPRPCGRADAGPAHRLFRRRDRRGQTHRGGRRRHLQGKLPNVEVSYSVPALTRTIRPAFTPDWFQKDEEGNIIYLKSDFPIDAGLHLDDFLRGSLKAYEQSNYVSFIAFDSTGMSAREQAEKFSSGVPSVGVYDKGVSPSANTKLRVGVCHKTVAGREYCLVVVVRAR